jgi:hypothetical protein
LDGAIKLIVNVYKWEPAIIGRLFLDDLDFNGFLTWAKEADEIIKIRKKQGAWLL